MLARQLKQKPASSIIQGVEDTTGKKMTVTEDILAQFQAFYSRLYQSDSPDQLAQKNCLYANQLEKLSEEDEANLENYIIQEILSVITNFPTDRAGTGWVYCLFL